MAAQFAVATLITVSAAIIYQQLNYLRTMDIGMNKDHQVVIDINSGNLRHNYLEIKNEMKALSGVEAVSVSNRVPGEWKITPRVFAGKEGGQERTTMHYFAVDEDYLDVFDLKLAEGRNFEGRSSDSLKVMLNEKAVQVGLSEPVGTSLLISEVNWGGEQSPLEHPFRVEVIGVVRDYHFESFHNTLEPMMLIYHRNPVHNIDYFTVKLNRSGRQEVIDDLRQVNDRFDPENPMEYHFLDAQFGRFLEDDEQRARVFSFFSVIVILISCMGLFALASYEIRNRMKEMGIRKVLGASSGSISRMFLADFTRLVVIGFLIAAPIGWWIASRWLDQFAYHLELNPLMIGIPGLILFVISLLTVFWIIFRAAGRDPVHVIRQES